MEETSDEDFTAYLEEIKEIFTEEAFEMNTGTGMMYATGNDKGISFTSRAGRRLKSNIGGIIMLKYQKKGLCKTLSILLVVVMLLTAPIGTTQVYALENNGTPTGAAIGAAMSPLSSVIPVGSADELEAALSNVPSGGTIKLTDNITYKKRIVLDAKNIILNVDTFTLDVEVNAPTESEVKGLEVKNDCDLMFAGSGQFNITVAGGNASAGVYVNADCSAHVTNVKVTVMTESSSAFGVYAYGKDSVIGVGGDVKVINSSGGGCGAKTWSSGVIQIEGTITASNYINLNNLYKAKESGEVEGGYLKYSAVKDGPGIVYVKNTAAPSDKVCEIDGKRQYATLDLALDAADDGDTITLLDSIVYESSEAGGAIKISDMELTFNLNGHDLTIRNPVGIGLFVDNSAKVTVYGAGTFTIDSKFAALNVSDSIFSTEGDVITTLKSSKHDGIYAINSIVNIIHGSITAAGDGIYTAGTNTEVYFGGPITVNPESDSNAHGVHLNGTDNSVEVSSAQGTINVTSGWGSSIYVQNGGSVTVGGSETPTWIKSINDGITTLRKDNKATVTVYGDVTGGKNAINACGDATIKIVGNVTSTAEAKRAICAINSFADSGDEISIIITKDVEGPGGVSLYGNSGTVSNTVTINGDVNATGTGNETAGVYASYGSVAVVGNVSAPFSLGAEAGTNGQIIIDGVLSGNSYVKVNNVPKTASDKDAATTKEGYHTYSDPLANANVWVKEGAPAVQHYTITVQTDGNGRSSANLNSAAEGEEITLTASANHSYRFKEWQVVSGGVSIANNKFNMPAGNVVIRAIFEAVPITIHSVTFDLGGGTHTGGGELTQSVANEGSAIAPTVTRSGYTFTGWDKALTNITQNLTVTAIWNYNGSGDGGNDGSSSGGSSSSGDSSNIIASPPAQDKPKTPIQVEIKVDGKVDTSGSLDVAISDKNITDAISKAIVEEKENGNEAKVVTLVLNVITDGKTVHNVTVNLPKTVQDTIISKEILSTVVVVDNPHIKIDMDLPTIKEINKQANADVNITVKRVDSGKLTGNAKTTIGNRPIFDFKINYGSGEAVQSFGAGSVSVTIPYTLNANEKAGNVQAVYVDASGKVQWLMNSVYDSVNKVLRFSTNHFYSYGVGYKQDAPDFTDIGGHWAKNDIEFVISRGLFPDTGNTTFSPDMAMTREMFVTALGRLANADVSKWANKNNIVTGIGDGKFAPDQSITREQMAVIMSNYAKTIGFTLPKVHTEITFADNATINTYAKAAVKTMQMAGVISGKSGNIFEPQGTGTRAEVSAVLRRFVELTISCDTAQGWTMNDSGKWMYYENGKPFTGKKNIDGSSFTFDQYGVTADVPKGLKHTTYTVQKGDSFWLIAHKLGCTMKELERLNNKSRFKLIYPGDVLRIPEK